MIRKYVLPLLAVAGLCFAIYVVALGAKAVPAALPVAQPAVTFFANSVAGAGIIEASSENIAIGTQLPGVVTRVHVLAGGKVKAGAPLFSLDDRDAKAQLDIRQTALRVAQEQLQRLVRLPRSEDVPAAEARVEEAEANAEDLRSQLALWESVQDKRAISQEEYSRRRYAVKVAEARVRQSKAELALLKAGTWQPDIAIAKAQVAAAEAQVSEARTNLDRLTICAPVDADVLQVKIRAGEYAQTGVLQTPLVLLGILDRLHVRVDIDENDAWRIHDGAPAVGYVRGNTQLKTPMEFVRREPYVVPKRSLTGDSTERVDTRVLQVLYSFPRDALPVHVGQQMDVFISVPPAGGTSATTRQAGVTSKQGGQP